MEVLNKTNSPPPLPPRRTLAHANVLRPLQEILPYKWLHYRVTTVQEIVTGNSRTICRSDDLWHERGSMGRLAWLFKDLEKFYQSWQGKKTLSLSYLVTPLVESASPSDTFEFIPKLLSLLTTPDGNLAYRALVKSANIDPTVRRILYLVDRLPSTGSSTTDLEHLGKTTLHSASKHPFEISIKPFSPKTEWVQPIKTIIPMALPQSINSKGEIDFWTSSKIYVAKASPTLRSALQAIGEVENFTVEDDPVENVWPRDPRFLFSNGYSVFPLEPLPNSDPWCHGYACLPSVDATTVFTMEGHPDHDGAALADFDIAHNIKEVIPKSCEVRSTFAGGNLIETINPEGQRVYLHGGHNILWTAITLQPFYTLPAHLCEDWITNLQKSRRVKIYNGRYAGSYNHLLSKDLYRMFRRAGLVPDRPSKTLRLPAIRVLAELEVAREVIQEDFWPGKVIFLTAEEAHIDQVRYHLDVALAALPGSIIALQDDALCCTVLNNYLASDLLTNEERNLFTEYQQTSEWLAQRVGHKVNDIFNILTEANFRVVRVPAVYHRKDTTFVNYINGLFVKGKDGDNICMTGGYYTPGEHLLRTAFSEFMKTCGIRRVYFCERPTTIPFVTSGGLCPSLELARRLENGGGVHCSTLEVRNVNKVNTT